MNPSWRFVAATSFAKDIHNPCDLRDGLIVLHSSIFSRSMVHLFPTLLPAVILSGVTLFNKYLLIIIIIITSLVSMQLVQKSRASCVLYFGRFAHNSPYRCKFAGVFSCHFHSCNMPCSLHHTLRIFLCQHRNLYLVELKCN